MTLQSDLVRLETDIAGMQAADPLTAQLRADVAKLQEDVGKLRREAKPVSQVGALVAKAIRTFVATFVGTLVLTLLPVIENLAKGNASFGTLRSVYVAAVVGGVAAGIRAVIALMPIFKADTDVGMRGSIV